MARFLAAHPVATLITVTAGFVVFLGAMLNIAGGSTTARVPAERDVLGQLKSAPFHVLTPARVPTGTTLGIVDIGHEPDGTAIVDLVYRLPNGQRLHIWETNEAQFKLGVKNPVVEPGPDHAGRLTVWREGTGFSGSVATMSATLDGVVVSVDAPLSADEVLAIADSLQ